MANYYADQLRKLTENPGSFTGTPGYEFARDQGIESVNRKMVGGRGSGSAMAAIAKYASGNAAQNYGNYFNQIMQAAGQTDQANNAAGQLDLGRGRLALDDRLGTGNLELGQTQAANALTLGRGAQATTQRGQDLDFTRGTTADANSYDLGRRNIDAGREGKWWDYSLGRDQLAGSNANAANTNALNWFTANTNRGAAQSADFIGRDAAARGWMPYQADPYNTFTPDRRPAWARGY